MNRRRLLRGLAASAACAPTAFAAAQAQAMLAAADFGVVADLREDQTPKLQEALTAAQSQGRSLMLPPGRIFTQNLQFPGQVRVIGQPGATILVSLGEGPVARAFNASDLVLDGVGFSAGDTAAPGSGRGLLEVETSLSVRLVDCRFSGSGANGLMLIDSEVLVEDCDFADTANTAIFSLDSRGLVIRGNRIASAGNGGIRIWRNEVGADRSIVTANRISNTRADGGGNGQNGNGINVFRADGVVIADNVITDSAFSAIRLNTTRNTQVSGNTCLNSGEVAIFSEFAFSGSIIADNIVDGAAAGISMTNFDQGGALAVASGNIVRNIQPMSVVNPDTRPYGIVAQAHAAVTGNVVESVPGIGISVGYGPFLEDVSVSGNVVRNADIGIGVSVAPDARTAIVTDNLISGSARFALAGLAWDTVESEDLAADAARFPHITLSGNRVVD